MSQEKDSIFILTASLSLGLNLLEEEKDLHDVVDRRDQEVRQLELLTAGVLVAPLQYSTVQYSTVQYSTVQNSTV